MSFQATQKKKLINFRPFLFIALSIAVGILCAYFLLYQKTVLFIILTALFAVSISLYIVFSKSNFKLKGRILFSIICLIIALLISLTFIIRLNDYKNTSFFNRNLNVRGRVVETLSLDNDMQKVVLSDISVKGSIKETTNYKMNLYITNGNLNIGDKITFLAHISDYDDTYQNKMSASFIAEKIKFYALIDIEQIELIGNEKNIFEKINCFIRDTLKEGMSEDEFEISYSLLLGKSEVIDDEVISSFRNTGVAHIFAVSGLHIGFLAMALTFVFKKLKLNKILSAFLIIVVLFFYSGICGFKPSSIRAVVMTSIVILSNTSGKKYDILSALSLAFILILFHCPFQLFCVGFQLSFCAVLGIVFFNGKLLKLFKKLPYKLASLLSISISAQILTLPITFIFFKKVSYISVFINVLFIPIVSIIFTSLLVLAIIGGIFSIPKIALFIPQFAVKGLKYCIDFCDRDFFLIYIVIFTLPLICYYIATIVISGYINIKKIFKVVSSLALALVVVAMTIGLNIKDKTLAQVTVTANESVYSIAIEKDNQTTIIVNKYSNSFYPSKLLKTIDRGEVENLVLCDSAKTKQAVYSCVSKFLSYYTIKNIYVGGDSSFIKALENSFSNINFYSLENQGEIVFDNVLITTFTNASGVKITKDNKSILALSNLNKDVSLYKQFNENYELFVISEDAINLTKTVKSKKFIFYGKNSTAYSVIKDGNYILKI